MEKNNIYLPHVEASALVWQAMSMGTRMGYLARYVLPVP